ncbi:MAG TPA: hypothetical protein VFL31_00355 [Nitrospiraceae bacterium]|nr:hypothetical protein [Nitrospiraceae bacterium]
MGNFDLETENMSVRNHREHLLQCQSLGLYAIVEDVRHILVREQEHQIDLATALGKEVVEVSKSEELV